jgi:DNA-binding transcriptional MerR regulator
MEYTVHKLGKLAGVSTRTLRYYDEIGILKPARMNSSGYRIYGKEQVDRLQQILFYRELDVSLESIKEIVSSADFNEIEALNDHRKKLLTKREQLDVLIANIDKTIKGKEGSMIMSNKEKFEGFKKRMIEDNEKKYGEEIRGKYGNAAIDKSNSKIKEMSEQQYNDNEKLSAEILETLDKAYATGNPAGELAQKAAQLHHQWLCFYWDNYTKEAHAGVAQMYVEDERFTAYYDKTQPGTAAFLRDAILIYTGMNA